MTRLRAWFRVAWYRLTRRWPRYRWPEGWDGGRTLTKGERTEFRWLAAAWKSRGVSADEPSYSKRRQP